MTAYLSQNAGHLQARDCEADAVSIELTESL